MSKYASILIEEDSQYESSALDYFKLMKPRVMSLVVFTAFCGMLLAPNNIHPFIGFVAILCVSIGAGAAAAINMWYDRDIDSIMKRTQNRPIVTGKIKADEALSFGIIISIGSVLLMGLCVNWLSSFLLAFTIAYYVFIYTMWLKRSSVQNVVIGGVSGALPPMIGWSAVTGNISLESISLFAIIFMWTPPHSWALALFRAQDYGDCKVPMMPVIKGEYFTIKQIILYSIFMVVISLLPYYLGMVGRGYIALALILGVIFCYQAVCLLSSTNLLKDAKKLFFYSIFYLFMIFFSLLVF